MRLATIFASGLTLVFCLAGPFGDTSPAYKVLPGITQDNLALYPVIAERAYETSKFIGLDEGIQSGEVIVKELTTATGLVRPTYDDGVWRERPWPQPPIPNSTAQVNQLALTNRSDHPLLLLAGEIVTGGKQDRIVARDRIVAAHSNPVALDVFCVEPHRWMGASSGFGGTAPAIAQPSVRMKAMAEQNQQEVWDQVAQSRSAFAASVPAPQANAMRASSSYASALENRAVSARLDSIAIPLEQSYEKLLPQLRSVNAVGVVVAVNGRFLWADVFASPSLLEKYWTKLIRSYAAEAIGPHVSPVKTESRASQASAQEFLNELNANRENVTREPGLYSNTEFQGDDFHVFILTSLLPNTGFRVHITKMKG
jgi:hypothetical protein